jgi:hypothetical protein
VHVIDVQVTPVALAGIGHALHRAPQVFTFVLETHSLPQRWKPLLHVKSHDVPLHDPVAFGGAEHTWHVSPHAVVELRARHAPPAAQRRVPASHVESHDPLTHAAVAPVGAVHALQVAPHRVVSVSATQLEPHAW